jgi:multidrug efflux system outer membrane protein
LNQLEQSAHDNNQSLKAAFTRIEQARATARIRRGELWPQIDFDPSYRRERYSPNQEPSFGALTATTIRVPVDLSYEIDLWGRVRRGFESARAEAQANVAAYYNLLLTLHSDLAQNYFRLRALDVEISTLERSVQLRMEQVQLVLSRFDAGIGSELDVARAETELASTEAESAGLARTRAELENTIAVLTGQNPSLFKIAPLSEKETLAWNPQPPVIPAGLPSALLERRPDIAEAERQIAAANARIGIAKAAFFPVLRLTGSGGFVSGDFDSIFNWDSRVWAIGPSLSLPIFAGGRNKANYARSKSAYEEALARYRQQVLTAFGEVENSLAAIESLHKQAGAQQRALSFARRAAELAEQRYKSGIVSYLEVVDANRAALLTERANAQIAGLRLAATIQLIKALGGAWNY